MPETGSNEDEGSDSGTAGSVPNVSTLIRRRGSAKGLITRAINAIKSYKLCDSKFLAQLASMKENFQTVLNFDKELEEIYVLSQSDDDYDNFLADNLDYKVSISAH